MKNIVLITIAILISFSAKAQEESDAKPLRKNKGSLYFTWGYHRDHYTNSDIHFKDTKTDNYNFTIHNATASDRLDIYDDFITGEPLTVPQYVFYGGYFFGNKGNWGIELGWDHLKYIVSDYQTVRLTGDIRGTHYDKDTVINPAFLHYEHTNGNNYLMVNIIKKNRLYRSPKGNHQLSFIPKLGAGVLIPKTQSIMFGNFNDGPFRPSGFVIGAAGSLRYDFFKYFFIEHTVKGSFVDYTGVKLWGEGRAKQHFWSAQYIFSFGFYILQAN